jgi:predicted small secreted protein|tara:strand:- start:1293 stop:1469 length:177 start_codon:yes stop_codon:yes gene_type:complete
MLNEVKMYIIRTTLLGIAMVVIVMSLGACGNTLKGIGTDIVKIGENIMEEEPKNDESK